MRRFCPVADPSWRLSEIAYDPLPESIRESRFAISNGFLGVSGQRAVTRGWRWTAPARRVRRRIRQRARALMQRLRHKAELVVDGGYTAL